MKYKSTGDVANCRLSRRNRNILAFLESPKTVLELTEYTKLRISTVKVELSYLIVKGLVEAVEG